MNRDLLPLLKPLIPYAREFLRKPTHFLGVPLTQKGLNTWPNEIKSEDLKTAEGTTAQTYSQGFAIHRTAASLEMSSLAAHGYQGTIFY